MINIEELKQEVSKLDIEIMNLERIKNNLQSIINAEINNTYSMFIPILDKYLNQELNKEQQNKLWNELKRHKVKDVISHLEGYRMDYKKVESDDWKHLIISKEEI